MKKYVESPLCLALDGLPVANALSLASMLGPYCYALKIHDLYDAEGPSIIERLKRAGAKKVWVDAKLHDTHETVRLRTKALVRNGANIITVHAAGEIPMMKAAMEGAVSECGDILAEIWAITVLTSIKKGPYTEKVVLERALMAKEAGLQGLVCSALEVGMLAQNPELPRMKRVVPGTRSQGAEKVATKQQERTATPREGIDWGATHLVAGSQVTKDPDPVNAFWRMVAEIGMTPNDLDPQRASASA